MFNLSGKIALVTGASSGLGWNFCQTLAKNGAHVIAAARRAKKLDELVNIIKQEGGSAEILELDVFSFECVKKQISALAKPIDILINNAGIVTGRKFLESSDTAIEKTFQVNTLAHFWVWWSISRKNI